MSPRYMHGTWAKKNPDKYKEIRNIQRNRYYAQTSNVYPPRAWEPWEDELIMDTDSGVTIRELSQTLSRSMKSISNRRSRLRHKQ